MCSLQKKLHIDETWQIHSFELQEVDPEAIPQWLQDHPSFTLHNKAAWHDDTELEFRSSSNTECTVVPLTCLYETLGCEV